MASSYSDRSTNPTIILNDSFKVIDSVDNSDVSGTVGNETAAGIGFGNKTPVNTNVNITSRAGYCTANVKSDTVTEPNRGLVHDIVHGPEATSEHDSDPVCCNRDGEPEFEYCSDNGSHSSGSSRGGNDGLADLHSEALSTASATLSTVFSKGVDESVDQFLNRVCTALDENINWKLTTSDPATASVVDKGDLEMFKNDAAMKVRLYLPDLDKDHDTDDVEEGSRDPEMADKSLSHRRGLLRTALIDAGKAYGVRRGKWILPVSDHAVTHDWFFEIAESMEKSPFGSAVEATWSARAGRGVIFVWVEDEGNEAMMWAPVLALWRLKIVEEVYFKPEALTVLGMRTHNQYGIQVVEFTSSDYRSRD